MEFTAQERKMIEKLRLREKRWPRDRWIVLLGGAFGLAIQGWIVCGLTRMAESFLAEDNPATAALLVSLFFPQCFALMGFAFYVIGTAIMQWHGNVQRMLLLRLLEQKR